MTVPVARAVRRRTRLQLGTFYLNGRSSHTIACEKGLQNYVRPEKIAAIRTTRCDRNSQRLPGWPPRVVNVADER